MSKELIVSSTRHETRVAVLEEDQVVEIYYQREKEYSLAGSIHKGCVTRVLPGMQSAFVDIGLDRDAFLYVSDFFEDNEEYDKIVSTVEDTVLRLEKTGQSAPAVEAAVPAPDVPVAASAPSGLSNSVAAAQPAGSPPGERPDGRDGRGRRSRRRKPQGRGGLPDSKYFSPRQGAYEAPKNAEPAAPEPAIRESNDAGTHDAVTEDFAVLPGESLAKYVVNEVHREAYREPPPEPESAGQAAEPESIELPREAQAEAEPAPEPVLFLSEPTRPEPEIALEPMAGMGFEDPVTLFAPHSAPESEVIEARETVHENTEPEAANGMEAAADSNGSEIPEAGIPTSLSATLREQNPRYQHRVSRRMRRKMRGAAPDDQQRDQQRQDRRGAQALTAAASPAGETPAHEPDDAPVLEPVRTIKPPERADRPPAPSISDLLREGQEIIVQIAKEPLGQKGARITSHIALPGRFLVYMPTVDHVGVSRKIPSDEERSRLKRILQTHRTGIPGGYIVRTAGDGKTEDELRADMMFLYNLWLDMRQKAEKRPAPALLHHDLDLVQRILRDQLTSAFKSVWVDNEEVYESILSFVQRFQPAMVGRIKLYTRPNPIFDEFNVTSELEKALRPKVWLKSGGYIVINQTEALVAIDINTGKYVGKSNRLEDTIVKTNTDAIKEIVRQIRLRDLGGIIVVDFIDMDERKNRTKVMQALEESMRADRAPYKILQFNDFGLVAITRKRVKQSLERTLCSPCNYCEGAGYIKSVQTVIGEVLQEAHKIAKSIEGADVMLRVNPEVAKVLKSNQNDYLQEIEQILGKNVLVKSDPLLHQTKFDLA